MSQVVILINSLDYLDSHRGETIEKLINNGMCVSVLFGEASNITISKYIKMGVDVHKVSMRRGSTSIFMNLFCLLQVISFLLRRNVDIFHLISWQAICIGGLAVKFCNVKAVVFSISGLGFIHHRMRNSYSKLKLFIFDYIFTVCLSFKNKIVICQNAYDANFVCQRFKVDTNDCVIFNGSGVKLSQFKVHDKPKNVIRVAFVGRLLIDKGVLDFIEAVRLLEDVAREKNVEFIIAGTPDLGNPASLSHQDVEQLTLENKIKFLGFCHDVPDLLRTCHIVCLPSYHEGFPKVLIEAAASGCAVVTTDIPGCRDAVIPGETAFLVPVRSPDQISQKIEHLVLDSELRSSFGRRARVLANNHYDVDRVADAHMAVYNSFADKAKRT